MVYNIKFNNKQASLQETVKASVKVVNDGGIVIRGENAIFDASETYALTGESDTSKLEFYWECSGELIQICSSKQGRILNLTER